MATANVSRTFAVDGETMWELWTDPEHLCRWFRPSMQAYGPTRASVDLHEGGAVRFEMIRTDGGLHAVSGTVVTVERPRRLAYTWRWDGADNESVVEIEFVPADGGTTVSITHTSLVDQVDAERHAAGWTGMLGSLAEDDAAS